MTAPIIRGKTVDEESRCVHYHSELDVVAIKFRCCGEFYPCYRCHAESTDHPIEVWPAGSGSEPALRCGVCRRTIRIDAYLAGHSGSTGPDQRHSNSCPYCSAPFNPGCAAHDELYFAPALVRS